MQGRRRRRRTRGKLRGVKRKPRASSGRGQRRADERAQDKVADARERLFALSAGGLPKRPIHVVSPALVESQASSLPCPRCDGAHEVVEHAAVTVDGIRLREASVRCRACGSRRSVWFRLVGDVLN